MNNNITIIGTVGPDFHIDHHYKLREVMSSMDLSKLNDKYRDIYLRFLHKEICDGVCRGPNNLTSTPYEELVTVLQDYIDKNSKYNPKIDFLDEPFAQAVAKIDKSNWLYEFLSPKVKNNIIGGGINLIEARGHLCNEHLAMILPYVLDSIKNLDNPILACSSEFISGCVEMEENYYKISDRFHRKFLYDCYHAGVQYLEYTGQHWRQI